MITFDEFWSLYNYRIAKKAARKAWEKLTEHEKQEVMSCLPRRNLTDKQWLSGFKMHPATFLNGERWEDEFDTEQKLPKPHATKSSGEFAK